MGIIKKQFIQSTNKIIVKLRELIFVMISKWLSDLGSSMEEQKL